MRILSGDTKGAGWRLPTAVVAPFLGFVLDCAAPARAAVAAPAQVAPSAPATSGARADRAVPPALAAATIYSVVPGYGLGHFLAGNHEDGMRFLAMDLGATALWMVGPSVVAIFEGTGMTPSTTSNAVFALGLLAQGGLKYWEVKSARDFVLEQASSSTGPVRPEAHADRN